MRKKLPVLYGLCLAAALFSVSCSKKQTQDIDNETQSVADDAIAGQEFMALAPAVIQHAFNTSRLGGLTTATGCDTLHYISGDTLFGTAGHADPVFTMPASGCGLSMPDGKTRSGMLSIRFAGKFGAMNAAMIIKLQGYISNGISYSCDSLVLTTQSANAASFIYKENLVNGICKTSNFLIKYSSQRAVNNAFADASPYISVSGASSGTNRTGRTFESIIPDASPLIKHAGCAFIDKGKMELTPDGYAARTVDFGDGTCDPDATFTVNGNTLAFKLK